MDAVCPTCKKRIPWKGNPYRPFCSKRCREMDLGSWVDGDYRIPVRPEEDDDLSGMVPEPGLPPPHPNGGEG